MPASKEQEEAKKHLKKLVETAKKEPAFGFCLPKAEGQPVIEFSKTKEPAALEKLAKASAGGTKTGAGKITLVSGKIHFNFSTEVPSGALKKIKSHFAWAGVTAKLAIVGPNGVIEDDEGAGGPGGSVPGDQTAKAELTKAFQNMAAALKSHPTGAPNVQGRIDVLTNEMMAQLQAKEFDPNAARAVFGKLQLLDREARTTPPPRPSSPPPSGSPSGSPSPAQVIEDFKKVVAEIKLRGETEPQFVKAAEVLSNDFKKAMGQKPPDIAAAQSVLQKAQKIANTPKPKKEVTSESFIKIDNAWAGAVKSATGELDKLRSAILSAAAGLPGLKKVDDVFGRLRAQLEDLSGALTEAIQKGNGTSGPEARKAADEALKTANAVANVLDKDPILSKIDEAPFGASTKFKATLSKTIEELRSDLAA